MYVWKHSVTENPWWGSDLKDRWFRYAPLLQFWEWKSSDVDILRTQLAISLLLLGGLTQAPPPVGAKVVALPSIDAHTSYRTPAFRLVGLAILDTWATMWNAVRQPEDKLYPSVRTEDGAAAVAGDNAGDVLAGSLTELPWAAAVEARGDIAAVCAIAQMTRSVLERGVANTAAGAAPLRKAQRDALRELHSLLWEVYTGRDMAGVEYHRRNLLEHNERVRQLSPPAPPVDPPWSGPPAAPSESSDEGGLLFVAAVALYLFLEKS